MDLNSAQAQVDAATNAAKDQLELNRVMLENKQDAADMVLLRKAAETVQQLALAGAENPT